MDEKNYNGRIRLFDNSLLEVLFKSYPKIQIPLWMAATVYFLRRAFMNESLSLPIIFAIGIAVFLGWPLFEYATHRWFYHLPFRGRFADRVRYVLHDHHHDEPRDHTRLLAPFLPTLVFSIVSYLLERAAMGPNLIDPFFGWVCLVYISYESLHLLVHKYNFKSRIFREFKRFHMMHHLSNAETNFGVTTEVWDKIFRTQYKRSTEP